MDPEKCVAVVLVGLFVLICVLLERWYAREVFKSECWRRAIERLRNTTGWEPLDAVNAKLYDAYRRLDDHA